MVPRGAYGSASPLQFLIKNIPQLQQALSKADSKGTNGATGKIATEASDGTGGGSDAMPSWVVGGGGKSLYPIAHSRPNSAGYSLSFGVLKLDLYSKGYKWRYYPAAIKRHIVRDHGLDVFHQWRDVVLADIDSLRQLISAAKFDGYAYSATCCDSSKRLCQRAGLEVQRDIAFLFPNQK